MTDHQQQQAARRLVTAARTHTPCPPVRDLIGRADVAAAYAVQRLVNAARSDAGGRPIGRKIGLTSPAVQAQLGVDRPDFGVLFADMAFASGAALPTDRLLQPRIEAEVAFVLGADLIDGPLDRAGVAAAVVEVRAALEIVDSRIAAWDISFADTVADNGSSGLFVLSPDALDLTGVAPVDVEMTLEINGAVVSTGNGAACLGDPLEALAWLARAARDLGSPLRTGDVVLSGALGPMAAVSAGDRVTASLSGLGSVSCSFL
ncbi:MAG: fumarylacetoacetate hydrolase family protein [Nocardioidaceae bacterium]